ncbi:MAG: L-aspartate oxidase [Acidimicrobiia bacterium]
MRDLLVLGSGVAGLSAALRAERAGLSVAVVTKSELRDSATWYAQGGVAAAMEAPDSPELHFDDTLRAGAGLCDADAVRILVNEGPQRVIELIELGATFDRDDGVISLTREGGHSLARVLHAGGDATGAEIERALVAAVRARPIELHEHTFTTDLIVEGGRCIGVRMTNGDDAVRELRARHTVLATGGVGQMFAVTTNPVVSTGDGVAMAWRAGAAVADVEFMQFHPTALHHPQMPRPLLSEALRGEGAVLRDTDGMMFMEGEHPLGDLAPRDVVARAITRRMRDRHLEHLWLDATAIPDFAERFPTIWAACQSVGLDPQRDWLPVAPAAHYLSGGVMADLDGATLLPGLWACGEVACSGVHGANRLASNSLLDGLVYGPRAVESIVAGKDGPAASGVMRGVVDVFTCGEPDDPVVARAVAPVTAAELRARNSSAP